MTLASTPSSNVTVTVDTTRISQLGKLISEAVTVGKKNAATSLFAEMMAKSPKKTGKLQKGWTIGADISGGFVIKNATSYLGFILSGTRPHVIVPKQRHALAFQLGGGKFFAKKVKHPGTKPNDFVGKSITASNLLLNGFINKALKDRGVL